MGGTGYVTLRDASDSDGDLGKLLRRGAGAEAGDVVAQTAPAKEAERFIVGTFRLPETTWTLTQSLETRRTEVA